MRLKILAWLAASVIFAGFVGFFGYCQGVSDSRVHSLVPSINQNYIILRDINRGEIKMAISGLAVVLSAELDEYKYLIKKNHLINPERRHPKLAERILKITEYYSSLDPIYTDSGPADFSGITSDTKLEEHEKRNSSPSPIPIGEKN